MLLAAYFCAAGTLYLFLLLLLGIQSRSGETASMRERIATFSRLSLALSGLGGLLFMAMSTWTGIIRWGQTGNYRLPQDYIEQVPTGTFVLAVGLLGLLSPIAAAVWTKRTKQ